MKLKRHQGLGDKRCPKCGRDCAVHWKSIGVTRRGEIIVELGRFYCEYCGWETELHETEIERVS